MLQPVNGFLLTCYFVYEHLAAFLSLFPALALLRLEILQAGVEGFQAGPLGSTGPTELPVARPALVRKKVFWGLTFVASFLTAVLFPPPVDVFLLLLYLAGFFASAFIRIERANLLLRTRQFVWAEVLVLWALRLLRALLEGTLSSSAWPTFLGLSRESTTALLSRNIGYAYLVLLLLALFTVPGSFLWYIFQNLTVVRRSPTFRFATLQEILADIIGRGEREEVY
ncbi:MAG: hypothetical protein ACP5NB_11265 [Chloroflexia bacterium]